MFERFTAAARAVVIAARREAFDAGADQIREEHLLLGIVGTETAAGRLLARLGVAAADPLRHEFRRIDRQWGLSDADARALAQIGIDLRQVTESVAQSLGDDALVRRRRRSGRLRFSDGAKQALALALRQAASLGDSHLGDEHLLLALLIRPGAAAEVLAARGVTYGVVRSALTDARTAP